MHDIPIICLTGGPCAGKTTLLASLEERLSDMGFTVITLEEGATSLMRSGLTPARMGLMNFQTHLLRHQLEREECFKDAARTLNAEKVVLLCDRGAQDIGAYLGQSDYEALVRSLGLSVVTLRDERYDAVVFLRSVATDAPHLYTCANNTVRIESLEEAREQDARTLATWTGHPHLRVIDNSTDLADKGARALKAICRVLGIPAPLEIERKYLLPQGLAFTPPSPSHAVHVVQHYLVPQDGAMRRIRARGGPDVYVYYYTEKSQLRPGVRIEREHRISRDEYERLLGERNPALGSIEKTRTCFVYKEQYFELDTFKAPDGLRLLELELTEETEIVDLPRELVGQVVDVTDDPTYTNHAIARSLGNNA